MYRRYMFNYQMGLGHDNYSEEKVGLTSVSCFSDNNQREFSTAIGVTELTAT